MSKLPTILKQLCVDFGVPVERGFVSSDGMECLVIDSGDLVSVFRGLRDRKSYMFNQLSDITAIDYPHRELRFEVVYHVLSMFHNRRLRIKVMVGEGDSLASLQDIFPCANWLEREIWDMYGIFFDNHSDLRRILTDYGFQGHPQRKDFPLTGYVEMRYDSEQRRVRYDKVSLVQDFRDFDFGSAWSGQSGGSVLHGDEKAIKQDIGEQD